MARLLVIIVSYLAALAASRHILSLAERGRSMFWSKEELHAQCQDVRVSQLIQRFSREERLRARCKSRKQAPASEPLVTSSIDLNECLGWDRQKQNFTPRAG
ncbi:hypothetical protein BDV38DRAFT_290311 [Aspergillus pseudotamarii]|uniref:Cyanovirin-N domain-containing protein n=1 Tax=Aspergillus pseudotamarii TaxID=132259 RepID=A0A5N6SDG7_ASPPS|nr:uncharacterized protein BDV38DRAFT_290311 [Aspergillus pseudotamarii]KAE8131443.1 hypothetical protein BDV38DRAFT_290311 [Aspergillus pseudotamarii]